MSYCRSFLSFPRHRISSYSPREFGQIRCHATKAKRKLEDRDAGGEERGGEKREKKVDYWAVKQKRFTRHIANLVRKGKVEEAEEVFQDMLTAKVRPSTAVFNHLISGLSHRGDAELAFKHFNNLKKRGLSPSHHTYTSLFKAITESGPSSQHLLDKVLAEIDRRDFPLNTIATNSMMVAMTTCGMLDEVLVAYGDMDKRRVAPDVGTFTSLLTSSSMDRERGMEKVAGIWRDMKAVGVRPDTVCYLSLLKCLRVAGITEQMKTINEEDGKTLMQPFDPQELYLLSSNTVDKTKLVDPKLINKSLITRGRGRSSETTSPRVRSRCRVSLHIFARSPLTIHMTRSGWRWLDRDAVKLFLSEMREDEVAPDNQMLDQLSKIAVDWPALVREVEGVASHSELTEYSLLSAVYLQERLGNIEGAEVLRRFGQKTGILTQRSNYFSRARSSTSKHRGLSLLTKMKEDGVTPDSGTIGVLMREAAGRLDYEYITSLMKEIRYAKIEPDSMIMEVLTKLADAPVPQSPRMKLRFNGFKGYYSLWKKHYEQHYHLD